MIVACIPAYNEERIISDIIQRTKKFVDMVVMCDDGSSDNTSRKAKEAGAYVIAHTQNKGKGAAMKSLFEYVKKLDFDVAVTMDGDGQFLPEEIPKLLNSLVENKSDIVIGYRFDDKKEMPMYRKVGNKLLDKATNMASNLPFRDSQSGFRAYSKKAISLIQFSSDGFSADSEILISASKHNLKISEEKVTVLYDTGGRTSTKNPLSHFTIVLSSILEIITINHPLRYLGIPGVIFIIFGIIVSVSVIAIFNDTRYFSIPSTLLAMGFLLTGMLLLMVSVLLFGITRLTKRGYL